MRTRERDCDERPQTPDAVGNAGGTGEGEEARRRARQLLDRGDEAIRRALSRDSRSFLAQNRQHGGQ